MYARSAESGQKAESWGGDCTVCVCPTTIKNLTEREIVFHLNLQVKLCSLQVQDEINVPTALSAFRDKVFITDVKMNYLFIYLLIDLLKAYSPVN